MKFKTYKDNKITDGQELFGRAAGPRPEEREADKKSGGVRAGLMGAVFHRGWKTTFMFSGLATACVYFTYIAGDGPKYFFIAVIFIAIYALITKLMVNLRS